MSRSQAVLKGLDSTRTSEPSENADAKRYLGNRDLTASAERHGFTHLRAAVSERLFQEAYGGAERTPAVEVIADLTEAAKKRNQPGDNQTAPNQCAGAG